MRKALSFRELCTTQYPAKITDWCSRCQYLIVYSGKAKDTLAAILRAGPIRSTAYRCRSRCTALWFVPHRVLHVPITRNCFTSLYWYFICSRKVCGLVDTLPPTI
jgi:hypothetical protein